MKTLRLQFDGFDWDAGNRPKIEARVSCRYVEEFFKQVLLVKEDLRHSHAETRYIAVGYAKDKRCFLVAFTWRVRFESLLIRPISARYAHRKEVQAYEKEIKRLQENP